MTCIVPARSGRVPRFPRRRPVSRVGRQQGLPTIDRQPPFAVQSKRPPARGREDSMSSRHALRAGRAVLTVTGLAGLLALPAILTWAGRTSPRSGTDGTLEAVEEQIARGLQEPQGFERPAGRSPLGGLRPQWDVKPEKRARSLETPLGFVDPAGLDEIRVQAPLVAGTRGRALGRGRRGEISPGFNALQIDAAAFAARTP